MQAMSGLAWFVAVNNVYKVGIVVRWLPFRMVKRGVLQSETACFAVRNAPFWNAKRHILLIV